MATHEAKLRLLEEMQAMNIKMAKDSLTASATAQIEDILQSSMSRREKRSALYKVRRNFETVATESYNRFHREYEMFGIKLTLTPADFLSSIDFSNLLDKNVTVQETPIQHSLDEINSTTVCESEEEHPSPNVDISSGVQYVPVALQPIVPIIDVAYKELTAGLTNNGRKSVPFRTYYELTIQQVLSFVGAFGEGIDHIPEDIYHDIPDYNHPLVVDYITTLRPFSSGNCLFVGKLIACNHPAYSISGAREKGYFGRFWRSSNAAVSHTSRRQYLDNLFAAYEGSTKISERRNLVRKIPYSEDWSGTQSGGLSVLVHLLLWLRKDVERHIDHCIGENIHYHHGYFYDPEYGVSYMTFDNATLLRKAKEASLLALRNEQDESPVRLPNLQ